LLQRVRPWYACAQRKSAPFQGRGVFPLTHKLIDDWHIMLRHAYSVRLHGLAVVFVLLQLAEPFIPLLQDYIPSWLFLLLTLSSIAAGLVAQFTKQKGYPRGKS
jgi:hypothetical protein